MRKYFYLFIVRSNEGLGFQNKTEKNISFKLETIYGSLDLLLFQLTYIIHNTLQNLHNLHNSPACKV